MVQMNDVRMVYGNTEAEALSGVSFTINEGEFVFLVGPSGSGKTTIIKLITGELSPTSGQITVNGFDMQGIKRRKLPKLRRTLGVIFQDFRLIDKMTVYENVAFAMRVVGASNKEIRRRVPQVLELVGLVDREKRYPAELSGGEQQRVAIARALVNNPRMIIADEPTGNLDPVRSLELMLLLEKINELGTKRNWSTLFPSVSSRSTPEESSATDWTGTTDMKLNRFNYLIAQGVKNIFTHGFMSFASVTIIIACLLIMGSFSMLTLNIDKNIDRLQNQNEVIAYVDETLSEDEARAIEPKIAALDNVASVTFVTREQAMQTFTAEYDSDLFDNIDASVFRHRYVVTLNDLALMKDMQAALKNIDGIADVTAHLDYAENFITFRNIVSVVSVVLIVILIAVSLFIMTNTIKLATFGRREEIAIMKMVGATNRFIRLPFVVEGLVLGLVGGLVAFLLQFGLYSLIVGKIMSTMAAGIITVLPFSSVALPLLLVFLGVGVLVGVFGGLTAIRNYLKV